MKNLSTQFFKNLHVFIILYALYGLWVFWDEHSIAMEQMNMQSQNLDNEIASAQKRLSEVQEFIKKRDEYKLRVEEVAKNIEAVQKQLPSEIVDNQIINFFKSELTSLNVKEADVVPGAETTTTYFISKDYKLTSKATFLQMLIFFERIGTAARIYNISDLSMDIAQGGRKGRFQVIDASANIQAYRFNPDFKVEVRLDNPTPGATNEGGGE
jgi:Tfp pilus assembly protein PilO